LWGGGLDVRAAVGRGREGGEGAPQGGGGGGKLLGLGHEWGIRQRPMQVTFNDCKMDKRKING